MKKLNLIKQSHSLSVFALCLSTALLSACSSNAVKQGQVSEAESCTRLKRVINDHPNQFKSYKKSFRTNKRMNLWTADDILPSVKQCQIWEWSTGLHSYACEWQVEKGESQAIANYEEGSQLIKNCLGHT